MTDTQILTLTIAIVFPALGVIGAIVTMIFSNKRIDESITGSNKRIDDSINSLKDRMNDFQKHIDEKIDSGFEHMELLLKLHEAEHHRR